MAATADKLAARLASMTTEQKLDAVLTMLWRLDVEMKAIGRHLKDGGATSPPAPSTPTVAPDRDLDSMHGDEEIKKDPKDWRGESRVRFHMSECEPEFLDLYAEFKDWSAEKDEEKAAQLERGTDTEKQEASKKRTYAGYGRRSAARARGWAARLRAGWKPKSDEPQKCDGNHGAPICSDPQCWRTESWD